RYFVSTPRRPPCASPLPYTTLFRSLVSPSSSMRLVMEAQTRADDGMDLLRVETFQAPNATGLPGEAELTAKIEKMAADLSALRKDRKSTRLNSSHGSTSYAVFCLKK